MSTQVVSPASIRPGRFPGVRKLSRSFAVLLVVAAAQTPSMAQSDVTPPTLVALSFGASSINVSSAPQMLTVTATITDDLSGVDYGYITFVSPSNQSFTGGFYRTSGTDLNGQYQAAVSFPLFVEAGTWNASVYLQDNAGNHVTYSAATLASLGFPSTLTVIDTNPDTTPPTLLGASFSPSKIDTSSGPQTVTLSLEVSDSQSGVSFSQPYYTFAVTLSPVGAGGTGPVQYISGFDFTLVSGTPQNGVWQATKNMPQYSGGNWVMTQLTLHDAVGNSVYLTPTQLTAMGINPVLMDSSTLVDSTPPTLTGLNFSPSVFNTSSAIQNVTITLSASDNLSGLDFSPTTTSISFEEIEFNSPSDSQFVVVDPFTVPTSVAGTPLAGTWQFTAQWPQYSEEGTWNASIFMLKDKVGNFTSYSPTQLTAAGFPSTIVITKPSLTPDGTIGPSGGTVNSTNFGTRASVTFPPGLVSSPTTVSMDVFPSPLSVPTPRGFTMPGTYFENLSFSPPLPSPVPAPGITVVLPLITPMVPGALLTLYHIDPILGLSPARNASGNPVVGTVDADGLEATFNNVVTLSTVVAYISTGSVLGDVNGDGVVNCVDVSIVKAAFGTHTGQVGYNSAADLNNDGVVDIRDLFIVTRQLPAGLVCH